MNREQLLLAADRGRSRARALSRLGDLTRAREVLGELIELLDASLRTDDEARPSRSAVARALADAYGILGGIEWREGNLPDAVRAYQNGRRIEQDGQFGISDSYNLTNALVVTILLDPRRFPALRPELEAAATTVRAQIEGERRDQWWAWADYGLLCLLLGSTGAAGPAYDRFASCGPSRSDYRSVIRVLRSLAEALGPVDDDAAARISEQVADLEELSSPG